MLNGNSQSGFRRMHEPPPWPKLSIYSINPLLLILYPIIKIKINYLLLPQQSGKLYGALEAMFGPPQQSGKLRKLYYTYSDPLRQSSAIWQTWWWCTPKTSLANPRFLLHWLLLQLMFCDVTGMPFYHCCRSSYYSEYMILSSSKNPITDLTYTTVCSMWLALLDVCGYI